MEESEKANQILDTFFDFSFDSKIIDVRTPAEFELGHIIDACNIPLLSNEERAEVGTLYKQSSPEIAFDKGIELVGPKMHTFLKQARAYIGNDEAIIYCWRGGKRSQSVLGSKALKLIVVGGKTGSGKTEILHELRAQGAQVLDLEGLANHKGSAFGWIGEEQQPSVEHFENQLAHQIKSFDIEKPIWVENESRMIGQIPLHSEFWSTLKESPLINISIPDEERVKHLVKIYTKDNCEDLKIGFEKIQKRLGGLRIKQALEALENNDYALAAKIALTYYDKSYTILLDKNQTEFIYKINFEHANFNKIATELIQFKAEMPTA